MSNDFYNHNDGIPATLTRGASASIRSEFDLVQAGFDKLPTLAQTFADSANYVVAGGSADAWTASVAATVLTSYTDGLMLRVKFAVANTTTTPTLNLNSLGVKQIVSEQGGAVNAGDIAAGEIATLIYNTTFGKFQIMLGNSVASAQVSAAAALAARLVADADAAAALVSATSAGSSSTSAASSSTSAQLARDAALAASRIFASTSDALSNGVLSSASLVAGATGTNGTFDIAFSGGGGSGAAGRFTVSGGALVSITLTAAGVNYTSAPTMSFAASAGLAGASATAVIGQNAAAGTYFYVPSANSGETVILYQNVAGTANEVKRNTNGELAVTGRSGFAASATPLSSTLPRVVEIAADALHGSRPSLDFYDGQTLRFVRDMDPSPASVLGTSNNGGIHNVQDIGTMFQDDNCQTPVTAAAQSVAIVRDIRGMDLGAELVTIAGFAATGGWTKSATAVIGTAATGDMVHSGVGGTLGFGYWIEFDLAVTSGSIYAAIGLTVGPTFTTSGRKRLFLQHLSNTTAGFYFHAVSAFTGTITNITCKKDSRNHLARNGIRALPTLQLGSDGVYYLDTTGGADLTSVYAVSTTVPVYVGVAAARTLRESKNMCGVIAGGDGLVLINQNSSEIIATATVGGVATTVYTRPGSFCINQQTVADLYVTAGITSSWVNGGERDAIAGTNGASRNTVNALTGASSMTSAKFTLNFTGTSVNRFYGSIWYFGTVSTQARRDMSSWLRRICGIAYLDSVGYDVFIVAGQSNAMGVGNYTTSTAVTLGQGAEFMDSGWLKPMADPTQHSQRASGNVSLTGSAWPAFCNTYYSLLGRRACIVGNAYSGVGLINDGSGPSGGWQSTGPLVTDSAVKADACISYLQKVNSFSRLRGVIWAGGEQDALSAFTVASYKTALISLRDRFRLATGVYNLSLYIISLDKSSTPATEVQYALIRQAQSEAASENEGIDLVVPYADYYDAGMTDGIHYNQTGLNTIGALAATNIAALIA